MKEKLITDPFLIGTNRYLTKKVNLNKKPADLRVFLFYEKIF